MSSSAESVLLEVSQINMFQGPRAVSLRTVSPYGKSTDSAPVLNPPDLWTFASAVSLQSFAFGLTFQGFFKSEGRPVPETDKKSSEACLTQNRISKNKPDNKKVRGMSAED